MFNKTFIAVILTIIVSLQTSAGAPFSDLYLQNPWVIVTTQDGKKETEISKESAPRHPDSSEVTHLTIDALGPDKGDWNLAHTISAAALIHTQFPKQEKVFDLRYPVERKLFLQQTCFLDNPWSEEPPTIIWSPPVVSGTVFASFTGYLRLHLAAGVVTATAGPDKNDPWSVVPYRMNAIKQWSFVVMKLSDAVEYEKNN